jgi:hypothetical protein
MGMWMSELADDPMALYRDAMRYRWLRDEASDWGDHKNRIVTLYPGPDFDRLSGEDLDAAVDLAMSCDG